MTTKPPLGSRCKIGAEEIGRGRVLLRVLPSPKRTSNFLTWTKLCVESKQGADKEKALDFSRAYED
jgi:hypothetical protein